MEKFMNEDIRRILDLLDEGILQGLEDLLVKEEGLKQKDWQGYPDVLMKAEISLRTQGLWEEAGQLTEAVSEQQGNWFSKVQLLRRAMVMYNKIGNDLAHVRCHRTARQLIPENLPARRRMAIWRPAGSALGYPGAGAATEALEEIEELSAAVEEWSVWECFQLHLARGRIYMGIGYWPEAIAQGHAFVDWAKGLPDDSAELHIGDMELDGTVSRSIWGDPGRWYCLCELFALIVVRSHIHADAEISSLLQELKGYLSEYEERWHRTQTMSQLSPDDTNLAERANDYRKGVATGHAFAGWVACEGGHYSEALALLARENELRGSLYSMGALYRAAAHAGMGDVELAKQCLIDFQGQETKDGQALRFLKQRREFDVLGGDKDFLAITRAWS